MLPLTTAPCTICWGSTSPLSTKTLPRARRASKPKSTPSGTSWYSRWASQTHGAVLPLEGAQQSDRKVGLVWLLMSVSLFVLVCPPAQGPCHTELHAALDMIASSQQNLGEKFTTFYLPNCDKHGFYKAKQVWQVTVSAWIPPPPPPWGWCVTCQRSVFPWQCESSLVGPPARCWCVSSWNGKKISGGDLLGDSECEQEVTHWGTGTQEHTCIRARGQEQTQIHAASWMKSNINRKRADIFLLLFTMYQHLFILTSITYLSFLDFFYILIYFFPIVNRATLYTFLFLTK